MTRAAVRRLILASAVVGTIGCDRVTKQVASVTLAGMPSRSFLAGTVRLRYFENSGGFLSLGASLAPPTRTIVFTVATGLMLLFLAIVAVGRRWNQGSALGLAFFVSGGVSNWFDRLMSGRVVDFLNVGVGHLRTGVFNVADMAILFGVALFVYGEMREPVRSD